MKFRVFYIRHYGCTEPTKKPDGTVVATYRRKRIIKDVEAESQQAAVDSINSLPEKPGEAYNRVWGACPAADHVQIEQIEGLWSAEEQPLFSQEELDKCAQ